MEHPEILPLIVIVVGILLSSLKKKPKPPTISRTAPEPQWQHDSTTPPEIPKEPRAKAAPKPRAKRMPDIPSTPIPADDDNAYSSEPHPEVPVGEEWRRAIIAHEILKRKF